MTDFVVLDNMIWIQRLLGEQRGSGVIDLIKKKCDTVILSPEITDAYAKTLELHYHSVPSYLSTLLVTELEVLRKVVRPDGPEPNLDDIHRKDRYLVRAARPYRGMIITLDNQDLLSNKEKIKQRHMVRVLTPEEYESTKGGKTP